MFYVGGIFEIYTLWSDCVDGKKAGVRVHARGYAFGPGFPIGITGGSIEFEDNLSYINPQVFNGSYLKFSFEVAVGGGGGVWRTWLGGAHSPPGGGLDSGPIGGYSFNLIGVIGDSYLATTPVYIDCQCI